MALLAFLDHSLMTAFTFAETLACWQRRAGRSDLPWQQYHTPYERWLSEVMLQQTQVETVIPYFERFLAAFPSVEALAAASEAQVMKLWAGLGYYSRGRNLHRAAQMVVKEMQGRFPTTADELIKLPGIGPSTAAAVAAFTSGEAKEPMIDGNVKRVLARIDGIPGRVGEKAFETALAAAARRKLPGSECIAAYTQGLMDLGSLVCRRKSPNCAACPVRNFCKAFALGCPEDYPRPKTTAAKKERWLVLVFVATSAGFWFAPVRGRIWKGLYAPIVAECSEKAWNTSVIAEVPEHLRFLFQTAQPCGRPRVHELTHQRLHLRAVLSRCEARIADGEALHTEGFTPSARSPMRGLGYRRRYWSMQKSLCANGGTQTLIVSEACFPGADWLKALDDGQLCRLDRQIGVQAFLQHIPIGAVPPYSQCRW